MNEIAQFPNLGGFLIANRKLFRLRSTLKESLESDFSRVKHALWRETVDVPS
jgi:hypothetical protein